MKMLTGQEAQKRFDEYVKKDAKIKSGYFYNETEKVWVSIYSNPGVRPTIEFFTNEKEAEKFASGKFAININGIRV